MNQSPSSTNFLTIERTTVSELLSARHECFPDKVYARQGNRSVTYAEIDAASSRTARGFAALGVKKGDTVCLMLGNSLEFLSVWFGLNKLGAIEFPINIALIGRLLESVLTYSNCRVVVIDHAYLPAIEKLSPHAGVLETVVVCGGEPVPSGAGSDRLGNLTVLSLASFESFSSEPVNADVSYSDVMAIMSTSGTTGQSKGVMLTYNHEVVLAQEYLRSLRYGTEDILYNCLPLFHNIGQAFCALPALLAGASIVIADRFSATRFWQDIVENDCTGFNFMGAMIAILGKQPLSSLDRAHHVRGAFGLPRPPGISEEFEKRFGVVLIEGYGQTEVGIVTYLPWEDRRSGSCGRPLPRFEVNLVDTNDIPVGNGECGEFVVRPREPFTITSGYYGLPEETIAAMRNLWWHTGDVGRQDEDGFFYFTDRKKDVIRRRGENISSAEIERVIDVHPEVLESAAVGVPSELSDEDVLLVVVRRSGSQCSAEALLRHCAEHLPRFAIPTYVVFAEELPKTPSGKVQKHLLRSPDIVKRAVTAAGRVPR